MKTSPLTHDELAGSVIAVPPLARNQDLTLNREANRQLIRHIESGGVSTLLYGGNANLYNVRLSEFAELLEMIRDAAAAETRVIPSVGPAFGTMMDQAAVLRDFDFATSMVLPQQFAVTPSGIEDGLRAFSESFGKPLVLYIKEQGVVDVAIVRRLVDDGLISAIKYAIVREQTGRDDFLRALVDVVDPAMIVSGIGEQPAITHMREFGLAGYTSGCVCIAPRLSMMMLGAVRSGDFDQAESIRATFRPLEDLRNAISPIRVLHDAVTLAGVADMGRILPLLSNLEPDRQAEVSAAAKTLLSENNRVMDT